MSFAFCRNGTEKSRPLALCSGAIASRPIPPRREKEGAFGPCTCTAGNDTPIGLKSYALMPDCHDYWGRLTAPSHASD